MSARHARGLAAIIVFLLAAPGAHAQNGNALPDRQPPLGNSFTAQSLSDLPSASTIFSLLDTSIPELINDRVDAGSLTVGQAARLGAHGSSWTQTMFRLGEVDISDPRATGTPLLLPGVLEWQRMDVATAALRFDANAAGPVVTLTPVRPAPAWTRTVELFGAPSGLLSRTTTTIPPAIARLDGWTSAKLTASGPLRPGRLGMALAASLTRSAHFQRDDPTLLTDRLGSLFSHLVYTPTGRDEVRLVGWVQRATSPVEHRLVFDQPTAVQHATSVHVQSIWERPRNDRSLWTAFAAFSARRRTNTLQPVSTIVTERLFDGPVWDLIGPVGTDRAWSFGARLIPSPIASTRRHAPQGGITLSGGSAGVRAPFGLRIGELVEDRPARVWDYTVPRPGSNWGQVTLDVYAGDTFVWRPRVTIDAGLRFEVVSGAAATNPQGVSWHDWYPSGGVRWRVLDAGELTSFLRFHRYGHRLALNALAYGESTAPTASVYRWAATGADPAVQQLGPLVSRVGPGTNGDPAFSALDPQLERPYVNEAVFGFSLRPQARTVLLVTGMLRHEGQLVGVVNTGAPISAYSPVALIDPGIDHGGGQVLIAYDRSPDSFGDDRYLLTNPAGHHATFASAAISGETTIRNLWLMAGLTAGRSEETSANRGFLATENDHGLIGEVFTNPNAFTNARGRPFTERGYTIKLASTYRFSDKVRLGILARYQDGQHFARLLIVPDLNQGAEAIRAFVNGKTRFTYTLTVDARLQKTFTLPNGRRVTLVGDAYNLLNTGTEIEEFAATGPLSRAISAVQPPRSIHLGFRFGF